MGDEVIADLSLRLLGGFEARAPDGAVIAVPVKKARALLAYLALSAGTPQARDKLAALLWEERDEVHARQSLRQAIAGLRQSLPNSARCLVADGDALCLSEALVEVDVPRFEAGFIAGTPEALAQALELCRGELLDGLHVGSAAFDDWLTTERIRLRERALAAMAALIEHRLQAGEFAPAVPLALRMLAVDPFREAAHRTLMRLHARQGNYGAALRQYRTCQTLLRRELGVAPEAETEALYRQISTERRHRPAAPSDPPPREVPGRIVWSDTAGAADSAPLEPGLPAWHFTGRTAELAVLARAFAEACAGGPTFCFLTGEPGIGKTTLIRSFLGDLHEVEVAIGQCLEQYGAGEAYLPVLDALTRLGRGPRAEPVRQWLRRQAPTWLLQMPPLLGPEDRLSLRRETLGANRERMLREMAAALAAFTRETPLVLVLEDLHWSDASTLELIAALARRRDAGRLLLLGTCRLGEAAADPAPVAGLIRDLEARGLCSRLALGGLPEGAVDDYLAGRFPGCAHSEALSSWVHRHSEGHPLYMVNLADYCVDQGFLVAAGDRWEVRAPPDALRAIVPERTRQIISRQLERVSLAEREVLEAASCAADAALPCSAATLGAALGKTPLEVEAICEELSRQGRFLRARARHHGDERRASARYVFTHSLYPSVLYEGIPPARRSHWHARIGACLETAAGPRAPELAPKLARHFERGQDFTRALHYLRLAAARARARFSNREAVAYLSRGLSLAERLLPEERLELGLPLLEARGRVYWSMADMASAAGDFESLERGAAAAGLPDLQVRALLHQATALSWLDRERCLQIVDQVQGLAEHLEDPETRSLTRGWTAYWNLVWRGYRRADAQYCVEAVEAARRTGDVQTLAGLLGRSSYFLSLGSQYREAAALAAEGAEVAANAGQAFDHLAGHFFRAWALFHVGEWGEMQHCLAEALAMAEKNGHHLWIIMFRLELAALHLAALDPEGAHALCQPALDGARQAGNAYAEAFGSVLLGLIQLRLQRYPQAYRTLSTVRQGFANQRVLMDWILNLPLTYGFAWFRLAQHEPERAGEEAERLCQQARLPGELSWLALGHRMIAEAALARGDVHAAEHALDTALEIVSGVEAPLAEWQVAAFGVRLHEQTGRDAGAHPLRLRVSAVIARLADSLAPEDPLREHLERHRDAVAETRRGLRGAS